MLINGGEIYGKDHDMVVLLGRFTGVGAANGPLAAVKDPNGKPICHGLICTRNGAGTYVVTYQPQCVPPLIMSADLRVLTAIPSPVAAQPKAIVAGVSVTFTIFTGSTGVAYDPTTAEEVWVELWAKNSVIP